MSQRETHQEWLSHPCTEQLLQAVEHDMLTIREGWSLGNFLNQSEGEQRQEAGLLNALELYFNSIKEGSFYITDEAEHVD